MDSPWRLSWRADPATRALADRHYSRQKPGTAQFVPPGRCLVMKTADLSAGWVAHWPFAEYVQHAWPGAWINQLFRNEGGHLSSDLIRYAVAHTRAYWPEVPESGIVTFINPRKVAAKKIPGWCYLRAGWTHVGFTADGLWVYQQLPGRKIGRRSEPMPDPQAIPGRQLPLF